MAATAIAVTSCAPISYAETSVKGVWGKDDAGNVTYTIYTSVDGGEATAENVTVTKDVTDATCTENGKIVYTAQTDGSPTQEEEISATGHTPGEAVAENKKEATCTEDGSYDSVIYCEVCGEEISREAQSGDAATGHTPGEAVIENEKEATCTEDGSYDEVVYCSECGDELSRETKIVEAAGHDWDYDYNMAQEPTCTEDGFAYAKCNTCKEISREVIPATGHTEAEAVKENEVEATCTEDGSYDSVVYCEVCGEEISRETVTVPAAGHNWVQKGNALVEPTCSVPGTGLLECSECPATMEGEIPCIPHTPGTAVEENRVEATCTEPGSYDEVVYCEKEECKAEVSRVTKEIPLADHTEGEAVEENRVEATCTETGSYDEVVYCEVCGEELSRETKEIDLAEHTPGEAVRENEVAETCTEDGSYDEVVYCQVCGEELSRTAQTVAAHHTWATVETVKEPTCTEDGVGYQVCEICGEKNEENADGTVVLPATGHTPAEAVKENEVEATCTEEGSYDEVVYCEVCEEELSREPVTVDALGHEWEEVYVSQEPTCTATGLGYYKCSVCGEQDTNHEIEMLPHTPGEAVVENNTFADCTAASSYDRVVYCTECNDELERETIDVEAAESHAYSADDVEFIWSDETSGVAVFRCVNESADGTRCNDEHTMIFSVEDFTVITDEEPTCTESGTGHYVASVEYAGVTATADTEQIVTLDATGHKEAEAVKENEVLPTCTTDGSFDSVIYCGDCKEELSRETITVKATGHKEESRIENYKAATCTKDGSYDVVVYCTEGDTDEIIRNTEIIPASGHLDNTPVKENEVAATCTKEGSYDSVVYCPVCGEETSREQVITEKKAHTPIADAAAAATCIATGLTEGSHCAVCGEVLKAQTVVAKTAHKPGTPVNILVKTATYTEPGSYNEAVYCTDCKTLLGSTARAIPQLEKKNQTITVKKASKSRTYKVKKVKKAKKSFKLSATATAGTLTYKKISGSKKITVSSSGKITVKKGTKKGTYKAKVRITAAGTTEYNSTTKTITVKVVVK